ncbi:MAG TPA: M48 family metallopeptidase [Verrucomicrobiae bacterium]|nr:M48 family metallopeptidase [Verrucomicrobiae bacterium]
MDFFARQDQARKKTKLLVFYFVVAVILIIALNYAVGLVILTGAQSSQRQRDRYEPAPPLALWDPQIFLGASVITLAIVFIGSAFKISQLNGGGSVVAESMGGRPVSSNTTNQDERKLLNVVEEMSIASGVPMPKVYVLDNEEGINAFAAGHTTGDAAVGVTRSCITKLSRDELQGVIGHEFSHILNGDMRLNIQLMGVLFGILCLATVGRILLYMRSGSSRDKNPLPLIGIALLIIGSVGVFFGRLIQAAISRQREFLADASSVQFTRNPAGLSGALQKIGGYGSKMDSPNAPDAGHMFFGNAISNSFLGALATHPPLEDRIRAIDPAWDGKFKRLTEDKPENLFRRDPSRPPMPDAFRTVLGGVILGSGDEAKPPVIQSRSVLPNLGTPTPLHLEYAEKLRDALPESVKSAVREPLGSAALIYALLLSSNETMRATQLATLAKNLSPEMYGNMVKLSADIASAAVPARLPMVNLALGALRQLSQEQFAQFSKTLQWLIQSDGKMELFEFVLQKIILRHLAPQFGGARSPVVQFYTIKPLVPDCVVVLSTLAHVSGGDAGEIQKAFDAGAPYLRAPDGDLALLPREQCGLNQIDAALNRLAQAVPQIKKNLIDACVHVVGADGVIQESEAELLRAIADTLDCPMPPFLSAE